MATILGRRDVIAEANDVKTTFSSWDGCMSKTYCKWPVIAGIIVGSLIILSILWCFARCLCCGAECACCCFRCCAGCCGSGRREKGHKHLESAPPTPYHQQQYQSHPQPIHPVYGAGGSAFTQTATFDASQGKPIHEDSLPAMPSWENAPSRKVEVYEEAESHEMDRLKGNHTPVLSDTTASPQRPMMALRNASGHTVSSGHSSPRLPDPYGYNNQANLHGDSHSGYRGAAPPPAAPLQQRGYGNRSPVGGPYDGGGSQQYGIGAQQNRYGDDYGGRSSPAAPRSPVYAAYSGNNTQSSNTGANHYGGGNNPYGGGSGGNNPYGGSGGGQGGAMDRRPVQGSWRDV